ncbi:hypothetical protein [Streptomyces yangpuensis]|nr:hypothetical protein [Streptomyces yangpuensis]
MKRSAALRAAGGLVAGALVAGVLTATRRGLAEILGRTRTRTRTSGFRRA